MNKQNSLQVDASLRLYVAMGARLHRGSFLEVLRAFRRRRREIRIWYRQHLNPTLILLSVLL